MNLDELLKPHWKWLRQLLVLQGAFALVLWLLVELTGWLMGSGHYGLGTFTGLLGIALCAANIVILIALALETMED